MDKCDTCDKPIGVGLRLHGLIPATSILLCEDCERQIAEDAKRIPLRKSTAVH
jgi:hypothetical protein